MKSYVYSISKPNITIFHFLVTSTLSTIHVFNCLPEMILERLIPILFFVLCHDLNELDEQDNP